MGTSRPDGVECLLDDVESALHRHRLEPADPAAERVVKRCEQEWVTARSAGSAKNSMNRKITPAMKNKAIQIVTGITPTAP
jgi:hypothetical protein